MTPAATHPPAAGTRSVQAEHVLIVVLTLMALVVIFQHELQLLDVDSLLRQHFAAAPLWSMLTHGIPGVLATSLVPLPFSRPLRQRHLKVHRMMGLLYIAGVTSGGSYAEHSDFAHAPQGCRFP
jgi:hypothetical protein